MTILFDYNRTIFNPETRTPYSGVLELLKDLVKSNTLILISRNEPGREENMKQLGIYPYFQKVLLVPNKTSKVFLSLARYGTPVFVIGDRVRDEIRIGNRLGYITIWIRQGKFANELPTRADAPTHTISDIRELPAVLKTYE